MNKIFRNLSLMLAAGALVVSCADYNETNNFTAEPDPTFAEPYKDLAPVKSYINREQYPNMTLVQQAGAGPCCSHNQLRQCGFRNHPDVG